MQDPVVCVDGHSYERANIERWFRESSTSPATGAPVRLLPCPACCTLARSRAPRLLRCQLVTDVVVSNHALRKSIEEHAQQCFNQVSAKEIVTVALLNPLLEPLRICAAAVLRRPRVLARLLRRIGRISIISRLGRFGCAGLAGALLQSLVARGMGPFALLMALVAGVAFQAGVLLCLATAALCAFGVVTRFVSREQIKRFFAPPLMEAAAYLICVGAYTHLLGFVMFRPEACEAQLCTAAATTTLVSLWSWAVQLNVSLLKVEDDAQRLRCLDIPNFALLCLWLWRVVSETRGWMRTGADPLAARPTILRGEAFTLGCICAALQCIYLITPTRKIRRF